MRIKFRFVMFAVALLALLGLAACGKSPNGPTPVPPDPNLRFAVTNIKYERVRPISRPQDKDKPITLLALEINPATGKPLPPGDLFEVENVPRISENTWLTAEGFPSLKPGAYMLYWSDVAVVSGGDAGNLVGRRSWIGNYELTQLIFGELGAEAVRFQLMNDGTIR